MEEEKEALQGVHVIQVRNVAASQVGTERD